MKNKQTNKVILNLIQNLPRTLLCKKNSNNKRGRSQIKFGMTSLFYNNNGFTLIELLVVVLIIGILTAVALPQYQKAVEKSRATQALSLVKSVHQAMQTYYLANGTYPTDFDELAVEIPWSPVSGASKVSRSNGEWLIQLYVSSVQGVETTRKTGKYKGAGFAMFITENDGIKSNQLYCTERTFSGNEDYQPIFDGQEGDYCQKIQKSAACINPSGRLRLCPMP